MNNKSVRAIFSASNHFLHLHISLNVPILRKKLKRPISYLFWHLSQLFAFVYIKSKSVTKGLPGLLI